MRAIWALVLASAATPPKVKWSQDKDRVFVTLVVKNLNKESVSVQFGDDTLKFSSKDKKGNAFGLELVLGDDVDPTAAKWELLPRSMEIQGYRGDCIHATLPKKHAHTWGHLIDEPKKYKKIKIVHDWADEGEEGEAEDTYLADNKKVFSAMKEADLAAALEKTPVIIANLRYSWCKTCDSADTQFVEAARAAKKRAKDDEAWKKVSFAVVDARAERAWGRSLGASCAYPCQYRIFDASLGASSARMESKYTSEDTIAEVTKYLQPAILEVASTTAAQAIVAAGNTTALGVFAKKGDEHHRAFQAVAAELRADIKFLAAFGASVADTPVGKVRVFNADESELTDADAGLKAFLLPRTLPLFGTFDYSVMKSYERTGLPVAKLWYDDKAEDAEAITKLARYAAKRAAKAVFGSVAFVEVAKSTYSYELREYGLNQPEQYPCFGIQSNATYNALKYGFEVPEGEGENEKFWRDGDAAAAALADFARTVAAGTARPSGMTEATPAGAAHGQVRKVVWRTWQAEVALAAKPVLLEVFGSYRQDNEKKVRETDFLAAALAKAGADLTVARYDASNNHVPPELNREKYSSKTEWVWFQKGKKLTKLKKQDPSMKAVVKFLAQQAGVDAAALLAEFQRLQAEHDAEEEAKRTEEAKQSEEDALDDEEDATPEDTEAEL